MSHYRRARTPREYLEDSFKSLTDGTAYGLSSSLQVHLRRELGVHWRVGRLDEAKEKEWNFVRRLIEDELEKGLIEGYGRRLLFTHFAQQGRFIARDWIFEIYRTINPEGIQRRRYDLQRVRGDFTVPGPTFVWSIDGHDKLKPYGIHIYACIDTYFRFILWIYVGISNSTKISCLTQYLYVVEQTEKQPHFVRSDKGGETVLLAQAHFELQQASFPEIDFRECYLFGTSTTNQRIEAWWKFSFKEIIYFDREITSILCRGKDSLLRSAFPIRLQFSLSTSQWSETMSSALCELL